ncbi:bifunctional tetrahydrofolate synthase/dihydrofolate synthase [uncultured Psychrobacter sp.]|uniref:bifunctional tetrahydrofolate synthase/dihydrofolate synthase n=1 Tax=uncultured Psychrobacter sp. TaxID=259303 RepID=UPI00345A86B9
MSSSSDANAVNTDSPNKHSTLTEWLDYMQQIHVSAIDMGLSRVLPVAKYLGVVQSAKDDAYVFTVAGTNGKGSTTAIINEMCQVAGYKTALYQSPHLQAFNERVRINGEMVNDQTLIEAFSKVETARLECKLTLSFFEMTTLAAFLIFAEADCDVWVLEVGLGGRLDVVNIVDPDMAVITNIGIDHVEWLGDNVEDIGFEKAGILRDNIPLVYGAPKMPTSVQQKIAAHNVTCYQIEKDFDYRIIDAQTWQYSSAAVTLQLPRPSLSLMNTANALSAVLASSLTIGVDAIEQALQSVKLAGRFDYREIAERQWLFDVAHNEQGVEYLLSQLLPLWKQHSSYKPSPSIKMLFSMLGDKDIAHVVERLTAAGLLITDWYVAEIDHPRAASIEQLQTALLSYVDNTQVHIYTDLQQATQAVLDNSLVEDLIVVCGSFHTIGEAFAALGV